MAAISASVARSVPSWITERRYCMASSPDCRDAPGGRPPVISTNGRAGFRHRSPSVVHLWPDPGVVELADGVEGGLRQRGEVGGRGVGACLLGVAGAGNDGGDARLLEDPAQRGLRGGRAGGGERGELGRGLDTGAEVDAGEGLALVEGLAVPVVGAVVVRGEGRVGGVSPRRSEERRVGEEDWARV